ncbi:MAG: hypothetical protein QM296_01290 [Bacillota bacterium]|nr:hypothetical protein [Bacillota bacterium]
MYLKKKNMPNGDIYLSIMEKYYDPVKKQSKERTIEGIGYVSKLKAQYPDPIAYFSERADLLTLKKKEEEEKQQHVLTIDFSSKMDITTADPRNVGYGIIKELYRDLELDQFWNRKTQNVDLSFNVDQIFQLLVFSRALYPDSEKSAFEDRKQFFENFDVFSLDDVSRCLDVLHANREALQQWIFKRSDKMIPRDLSVAFFNCTNYSLDIGRPDADLKDEDGNVQMGLLTDRNGIPLAFELFPDNESEKLHLRSTVRRVKEEYSDTRVIYVADLSLNTEDNICFMNGENEEDHNSGDGYVYGQSVCGADAEFKAYVLADGYTKDSVLDEDGNKIAFIHKSRIYPKEISVHVAKPGGTPALRVDQKQMVYYSDEFASKQRKKREAVIECAKDLIENPQNYDRVSSAAFSSYVINLAFHETSGEIIEGQHLYLDTEKIKEEEKYDGYYSIVSSELEMSDFELLKTFSGLDRIEEAFEISTTELSNESLYVSTDKYIDAYFTTSFTVLVIIRLLQAKLQDKFPVEQILESLSKYCCIPLDATIYQFVYYDEVLKACSEIFDKEYSRRYLSRQQIQSLIGY